MTDDESPLVKTPLHALHVELGAKMVPFAGYDMPVQYPTGVLKEHLHTRASAGLFDVSHMGQRVLAGPDHETVARALELILPGDILGLQPGRMRYSMLLKDDGGIVDDLMVTRTNLPKFDGTLGLVFNGARKSVDDEFVRARLPKNVSLIGAEEQALLALQGPLAEAVLSRHCAEAASLGFMQAAVVSIAGIACGLSRSGYTGEDGYEISVAGKDAERLARILLGEPEVLPIGLGARDSLRLEAGLCLYGHDIDETTDPVEANLVWSIGKRRRAEKGFPAAEKIMAEVANGPKRLRIGILPAGRAPAREGTEIADLNGRIIGKITSGGYGPTLNAPLAMGYVEREFAADGTAISLLIRGKSNPARVAPMPFVPHRYKRAKS